ncbi:MAG: cysteine methyltransferase [Thermoplasmata archaeon]|nr:MAG: cysteine methyltransferase [Thermoplasmata archaeon]
MVLYYDTFNSPLGHIYVVFNSEGIVRITIGKERFENEYKSCIKKENREARAQFNEYFEGKRKKFSLPINFQGTSFQKKVWNALKKIPYGKTCSYEWVAKEIGKPRASRAVGNAVGANPLPIVIPCHRVIRKNGKLGGYGYGTEMKKRLLEHEQ